MSKVAIQGAATGTGVFTLASPATNTDRTLTIPDVDGTIVTSDASGNVGIGTTTQPSESQVRQTLATSSSTYLQFARTATTVGGSLIGTSGQNFIVQTYTGAIGSETYTERMRIDSSGNLLVGKTSSGVATIGAELRGGTTGDYAVTATAASQAPILANRTTSDGELIQFRKDNTTVGKIGCNSSLHLFIGKDDTGLNFQANEVIAPSDPSTGATRDNAIDLGSISARFDDIYATNGTIQTSDRNEKQDIEALSEAETRVAVACKGLLRKFRWKDAVAEKGDEARIHFGIIAQDLQDAFAAEGLDAGRYAMFISSTWTDEETGEERTRLGVRYPELLAFIIGAI